MIDDFFLFIGGIFLLLVLFVGSVVGASIGYKNLVDKPACEKYGKMTNQETFYSLGTSCIVKYQGEWVDLSVATGQRYQITTKAR